MQIDDIFGGSGKRKRSKSGFGLDLGFGTPKTKRDQRRTFTRTQKNEIWAQQNGKCANAKCRKPLDIRTVEYDHKKGWAAAGRTVLVNGQALCPNCHKLKTHKQMLRRIEKKPEQPKSGFSLFGLPQKQRTKAKKTNPSAYDPFNLGF